MTDEKTKIVQVIRPTKEFAGDAGIKRFAAYCRVSTDSDDQINSFLTQVRYYTEVAREDPTLELVDIYADEAVIIGLKPPSTNGRRFSPIFYLPGISRYNTRICHF